MKFNIYNDSSLHEMTPEDKYLAVLTIESEEDLNYYYNFVTSSVISEHHHHLFFILRELYRRVRDKLHNDPNDLFKSVRAVVPFDKEFEQDMLSVGSFFNCNQEV